MDNSTMIATVLPSTSIVEYIQDLRELDRGRAYQCIMINQPSCLSFFFQPLPYRLVSPCAAPLCILYYMPRFDRPHNFSASHPEALKIWNDLLSSLAILPSTRTVSTGTPINKKKVVYIGARIPSATIDHWGIYIETEEDFKLHKDPCVELDRTPEGGIWVRGRTRDEREKTESQKRIRYHATGFFMSLEDDRIVCFDTLQLLYCCLKCLNLPSAPLFLVV